MLTPEQLSLIPDTFDSLFQDLDEFIIRDYARRLKKAGSITDTAEWLEMRAAEIGLSKEAIQKETARILKMTDEEIKNTFENAAFTSAQADVERFASAGLSAERIASSEFLQAYVEAAYKQTAGSFVNLGNTLGFVANGRSYELTEFYERKLDEAQMRVSTGVQDYRSAIRNAVKEVSDRGVQTIDYDSGWRMNIASAARMVTLTGINQMAMRMNDAICDELGLDLVEITAHAGARPSHSVWQGQIYSRNGRKDGYEDLYEATGLGNVDGLCGANCRHNYYGYFEGSPRAYSDHYLKHLDDPVEVDGKEYTPYEASQRQRYMERQIRKTKRELVAYEEAGLDEDFTAAAIKLRRQREAYKDFSRKAKLRPKLERTQEISYNRSISARASARTRKRNNGGN